MLTPFKGDIVLLKRENEPGRSKAVEGNARGGLAASALSVALGWATLPVFRCINLHQSCEDRRRHFLGQVEMNPKLSADVRLNGADAPSFFPIVPFVKFREVEPFPRHLDKNCANARIACLLGHCQTFARKHSSFVRPTDGHRYGTLLLT